MHDDGMEDEAISHRALDQQAPQMVLTWTATFKDWVTIVGSPHLI